MKITGRTFLNTRRSDNIEFPSNANLELHLNVAHPNLGRCAHVLRPADKALK